MINKRNVTWFSVAGVFIHIITLATCSNCSHKAFPNQEIDFERILSSATNEFLDAVNASSFQECLDRCCNDIDERCNVVRYRAANNTFSCLLYECKPLEKCYVKGNSSGMQIGKVFRNSSIDYTADTSAPSNLEPPTTISNETNVEILEVGRNNSSSIQRTNGSSLLGLFTTEKTSKMETSGNIYNITSRPSIILPVTSEKIIDTNGTTGKISEKFASSSRVATPLVIAGDAISRGNTSNSTEDVVIVDSSTENSNTSNKLSKSDNVTDISLSTTDKSSTTTDISVSVTTRISHSTTVLGHLAINSTILNNDTNTVYGSYTVHFKESVHLIIALVIGLVLLIAVFGVLFRRLCDSWERRHYQRMDFLIDGMYNVNTT